MYTVKTIKAEGSVFLITLSDGKLSDTCKVTVNAPAPTEPPAVGELTMGRKFLGITVEKVPVSMRITCDANGNLS